MEETICLTKFTFFQHILIRELGDISRNVYFMSFPPGHYEMRHAGFEPKSFKNYLK